MKKLLKCSICGNDYTPTGEERKLTEAGDLIMTFCDNCCTVKDEPLNINIEDNETH